MEHSMSRANGLHALYGVVVGLPVAPLAVAGTFSDDFNRPDGDVGNGWQSGGAGCDGPIAQISNQELASVPGSGPYHCYGNQETSGSLGLGMKAFF
jgi:hypothetical protein